MKLELDKIKKLKTINEEINTHCEEGRVNILRVPNGLIYTIINYETKSQSSVFVPLGDVNNGEMI